jgi:DNA-directed RNA polymerase specialized sigma24 family protein
VSGWAGGFATTQWTLVWTAAREDPRASRPAFAELFQRYWQPLYFVARQKGLSKEDAEDAIQEFFSSLLSDSFLGKAHPIAGRFRSYLSVAWKRFLIDDFRHNTTEKRGGGLQRLVLDVNLLESQWQAAASDAPEVDQLFEKAWAENVLANVRRHLAAEYAGRGRAELFNSLIGYVASPLVAADYERIAAVGRITPGAAKVALHRLRRRFGETLRDLIAETVADPEDIDGEIDELLAALK